MRRTWIAAAALTAAAGMIGLAQQPPLALRPLPSLAAESPGWDGVVNGILTTFDDADVVMLGEAHRRKVDAELRLRLVRDPDFPKKVRVIVCEMVDPEQQPVLDRYIRGDRVSEEQMQALRIDASFQPLFAAIRDVNGTLPTNQRIRVLPGSEANGRDGAIAHIYEQVATDHRKVLAIYGSGHVWRDHGDITTGLEARLPGRVFVAETITALTPRTTGPKPREYVALDRALESFDATLQTRARPVLVLLRRKPATAGLAADPYYLGQAGLGPTVSLGDDDDAIVYFGRDAEAGALLR